MEWLKEGEVIRGAIYERQSVKIMNVTEENSGTYTCEGTDLGHRFTRAWSKLFVGCKLNYFSKLIFLEDKSPI